MFAMKSIYEWVMYSNMFITMKKIKSDVIFLILIFISFKRDFFWEENYLNMIFFYDDVSLIPHYFS